MARLFAINPKIPMIKAVLFDLDDTLLDRDASLVYFIEQQHRRLPHIFNAVVEDLTQLPAIVQQLETQYSYDHCQ